MSPESIALLIFICTYAGVALGEFPGLALDRTGMALLGAIAMVAFGCLPEAEAMSAIDVPTILLLFGLMVVSSQFRLGGFYTHVALRISAHAENPVLFLGKVMLVSAVLSAVLANDIVCLAFTPVLCVSLLRAGLNPIPYLLGLAISSNIGSAATIIGNPQNMLIGQVGHLHFGRFTAWCIVPSVLALGAAYLILIGLYRGRWRAATAEGTAAGATWPEYNAHQSRKGIIITALLMASFFTDLPRELSALVAAGVLLCSRRMATRSMLGLVDWHLITLFCALFIVVRGLEMTGLPAQWMDWLGSHGWDITQPHLLTLVSVCLSNLVSNVPATMLLMKFLPVDQPEVWYVLAVSSTFAGNLITIGSIANLITFEQAQQCGIRISFGEHARAGIPVTLASIAILLLWLVLIGS